ncbi:MAG: PepSY-associated TM helix domain-containing protein [Bacteroidota bacterium]
MRLGKFIKKRIIGPVHLWLGLVSGIVIVIVSITGCFYVFEKELKAIFYSDNIVLESSLHEESVVAMQPASLLLENAKKAVNKAYQPTEIRFNGPDKTCYVQFYKRKEHQEGKQFIWYSDKFDYLYRVFLNPYTGEVLKVENTQWEFFWFIIEIHSSLLIGPIGTTIISVSILVFVLMLLTGIVLWWPHNWKSLRINTWFRWKSTTKWKRKNYDLHNIPGFYILFFALIISITGLSWSFDWVKDSIVWVGNGGRTTKTPWPQVKSNLDLEGVQGIDKVQASLFKEYPDAFTHRLFMPRDSVAPLFAYIAQKEDIPHSWQYFDQYSGEHITTLAMKDVSAGEKLYYYGYSLHVGSVLSFPGKVLAFFASLVSASLPITGFFIWWNRRRKEGKKAMKMEKAGEKEKQNNPRPQLGKKALSKNRVKDYEEVEYEI